MVSRSLTSDRPQHDQIQFALGNPAHDRGEARGSIRPLGPRCRELAHRGMAEIAAKAVAAISPAQEWQDISTAPKNGTPILVICHWSWPTHKPDGEQMAVCWWSGGWQGGPSKVPGFEPTSWQPLPATPVVVIADDRGNGK